ncbi:response regulator [bacterium]|nr:MAG: response regulator [bacterium]
MTKVLIIDDDADFVEANKIVLEAEGYDVSFAYDGDEGLKKIKEIKPDIVILDVMMKSKSEGFSLAQRISKDPALKNIPILMISAVQAKTGFHFDYNTDADYIPVDNFLEKPVSPEKLIAAVKALVH